MAFTPNTPAQALGQLKRKFLRRRSWKRLAVSLFCSAAAAAGLFGLLFGMAAIQGNSMNPAVRAKDFVLFSRMGACRRGDIIIFRIEDKYTDDFVKRVVGLPGETVDISSQGTVLINGEPLQETYAVGATRKKDGVHYPVTLKNDEYFVLGDNREDSRDSRNYGPIPKERIIGRMDVLFRIQRGQ